jgi:hypothetical protein
MQYLRRPSSGGGTAEGAGRGQYLQWKPQFQIQNFTKQHWFHNMDS